MTVTSKPMEKSSSSTVEVTVISAEDLRISGRSINKSSFVTIETGYNNPQSTNIDSDGGSYPSWNQKLQVSLPHNAKHIIVQVKCKIAAGAKTIGSVSIPIRDIFEDYTPPDCLHFLSYRLRDGNGERNGIVNFSIRKNGQPDYISPRLPSVNVKDAGCKSSRYACRPMPASIYQARYNYNTGNMAIGVPVYKGYPRV